MTAPRVYPLTDEQRAIVEAPDGPMVVLAGAGTGKTRVIVERVRWLLETHGTQRVGPGGRLDYVPAEPVPTHGNPFERPLVPEQLLVVTYNTKAAAELQDRLDQTAGVGPAVRARMTVKNFHGFCHGVLSALAGEAELPALPTVLDGPGQVLLLRELRPDLDLLYHSDWTLSDLVGFINRAKDELVSVDDFDAFVADQQAIYEAAYGSYEAAADRLRATGSLEPLREVAKDYKAVRTGERREETGLPAKPYDPEAAAKTADKEARRTVSGDGRAVRIKQLSPEQQALVPPLADSYLRDGAALEIMRQREMAAVYRRYQEALAERGALDFAEQIAYVISIFRQRPNLLRRWQRQYRYILVDEFQDANAAQIELIELLGRTPDRPDNVMVVGDDDQSIYHFRGAVVNAFKDFTARFSRPAAHAPGVAPDPLPRQAVIGQNFRSVGHVLTGANGLITANASRIDATKRLVTQRDEGLPIEVHICNGDEDEAVAIADTITALAGPREAGTDNAGNPVEGRAAAWNSVAILYRKHRHRDAIVKQLQDEGIPFTVVGGLSLFDLPEIRDTECGLRAVADPLDDASLVRVMTSGPWRLDAVEILRVTRDASFDRAHVIDAVRRIVGTGVVREDVLDGEAADETGQVDQRATGIAPETRAKLRRLLEMLNELGALTFREGPYTVLTRYLERSGALLDLLATGTLEAKRGVVNIGSLMRFASDWQAERPSGTLADFLAYLDAYKGASGELPTAVELSEDVEGVRLMTLYQAKGLEFPNVVVPHLLEGEWPAADRAQGWFPVELLKGTQPDGDAHIEEERRLLYVAMTRAQERLVLTTFGDDQAGKAKKRSRFVDELVEVEGPHLVRINRTESTANQADQPELTPGDSAPADADPTSEAAAAAPATLLAAARRVMPIPSPQERRLAVRLRAAELISLLEGVQSSAPETPDAVTRLTEQLVAAGLSASVDAAEARERGLDPITLRSVVLDSGDGANLLRVVALPPKLSYTSISAYQKCPAKFAFAYVYRIPPPDRPAAPLAFGTTVHAAFEEFTRERRERIARGEAPPTREDLDRIFRTYWKPTDFGDAVTEKGYARRVGSLLDTFWTGELEGVGEAIHEELDFTLVLDPGDGTAPIRIKGSIDRIDRLPSGGIEVVDYKTGKVASQTDVRDNLQLVIYALACRDTLGLGNPERVTLYFTESAQRMSTSRSDEELDAAREQLISLVQTIRTGNFAATPGKPCRFCDYRPICADRADSAAW